MFGPPVTPCGQYTRTGRAPQSPRYGGSGVGGGSGGGLLAPIHRLPPHARKPTIPNPPA